MMGPVGARRSRADPMEDPGLVAVVLDGAVHRGVVVPEHQRPRCPAHPHDPFGAQEVVMEEVEQAMALVREEPHDPAGEQRVHEEGPDAAVGIHAHHGVDRAR